MKTMISIIVTLVLLTFVSLGQKVNPNKVPDGVKTAFLNEYPKAMQANWRMQKADFQVLFTLDRVQHAAKYDKNGQWIDKETRISVTELPNEVQETIAKKFKGYKAYEGEKIETPAKGMLYNVGLAKEKKFLEVHFSANGDVLDKVTKKMKSEWGKDND